MNTLAAKTERNIGVKCLNVETGLGVKTFTAHLGAHSLCGGLLWKCVMLCHISWLVDDGGDAFPKSDPVFIKILPSSVCHDAFETEALV